MSGMILNELDGGRELQKLIMLVSVTIGANFLIWLIIHGINKIIEFKSDAYGRKYDMGMSEKILAMDYEDVENHEVHMKKQRIDDMRMMGGAGLGKVAAAAENILTNLFKIIFALVITYRVFISFSDAHHSGFLGIVNSWVFSVIMILVIIGNVVLVCI